MAISHLRAFFLIVITVLCGRETAAGERRRPQKLFVFGDSYADTGNVFKEISPAWHEPYGITFPGKPAGRFSDGRVFTDYIASFLKLRSPVPYRYRGFGKKLLPNGMNFAVGGSGVFDTLFFQDNLTVQIDQFAGQIAGGVFSEADIRSSVAAVSVSGNDYSSYTAAGGTLEGLKEFTPRLIHQLQLDLKRLHDIGVPKVAVADLNPIGCLPYITKPQSNSRCNTSVNKAVSYHNKLLRFAVRNLNSNATGSPFVIINLHRAFTYILKNERKRFPRVLKPCCAGVVSEHTCGDKDINGTKLYTVCSRRRSYFYWDNVHLTQAGWSAVFSLLWHSLRRLYI